MTTVTKLEMQFLQEVEGSDHSSDGHGICAWIEPLYFSMPMRQVRGVMTTLTAKGVITVTPPEPQYGMPYSYVAVDDKYMTISTDPKSWSGYDYCNLEMA